jgi:hypothetical protein
LPSADDPINSINQRRQHTNEPLATTSNDQWPSQKTRGNGLMDQKREEIESSSSSKQAKRSRDPLRNGRSLSLIFLHCLAIVVAFSFWGLSKRSLLGQEKYHHQLGFFPLFSFIS